MAARKKAKKKDDPRTVLLLGGGAPNFPLMAGALLAFHEAGVDIDVISMTGAGAVLGLIYLAPKNMTQEEALKNAVNYGVSDAIYSMIPINYKLFNKPGRAADAFRDYWATHPMLSRYLNQYGMTDAQKLESDWVQLMAALMCPTDVDIYSKGLCAHAPFIENVVDFDKLKDSPIDCVLNAYCIEDQEVAQFRKDEIDIHHFRACLSFPFIYPPYRINGKHYYEGAAYQALNDEGVVETVLMGAHPNMRLLGNRHLASQDRIIIFNVMVPDLIRRPRNLWDAYGQSIIMPLVANAQSEERWLKLWVAFGHVIQEWQDKGLVDRTLSAKLDGVKPPQLHSVPFKIPEEHQPYVLDWTKSNLEYLFAFGKEAGEAYIEHHPSLMA